MWRDYCARLKQRSSGMGALRHQEAHFDSISRASPKNVFEPPQLARMRGQQMLFPPGLCPPCLDGEDKDLAASLQTQIIWSPLFDGIELSSGMKELGGTGADLPVGWRTAEQKILELKNLDGSSCNGEEFVNLVSSSASNSDVEPQAVWDSAKCLLQMKDLPDSPNDQECGSRYLEDRFLLKTCDLGLSLDPSEDFEKQGLSTRNIIVEGHNIEIEKLTGHHPELSMEESKYQSCSAGDSSVCDGGIGRGDSLETRPMMMKTSTNNDSRRHRRVNRDQKVKKPSEQQLTPKRNSIVEFEQQPRHAVDKKPCRRAYLPDVKEDGCRNSGIASQRWNSGSRTPMPNARREPVQREDPARSSKLAKKNFERHGSDGRQHQQQLRKQTLFSDEVVSVASATGEEEASTTSRSFMVQQPHNTELVSALAEMNLRELRALQCSAAVMRHNIGILEDDVKSLLNCVERKSSLRYSWWRLFKDFMVAAGLVTGAFGLRTVIDIVSRSTYRHAGAALQKIINKQEKMALAAFLLTVGARFGKQTWSRKKNERKTRMSDQLSRIRERVALMSHLASTATVDIVRAPPPPAESE